MSFNVRDSDTGTGAEDLTAPAPPIASAPGLVLGGMENAKVLLATHLQTALPPVITALRSILDVPPATSLQNLLPMPDKILPFEPPALDADTLATTYTEGATALIYVSCMRLLSFRMTNQGPPDWEARYAMSVITWVKAQLWEDTIAASNNLVTAVRACLLAGGQVGLGQPDYMRIDVNTYTEVATEPEDVRGNRHVRPSAAQFQMRVLETLTIPPIADVTDVNMPITMLTAFSTLPNAGFNTGPFEVG